MLPLPLPLPLTLTLTLTLILTLTLTLTLTKAQVLLEESDADAEYTGGDGQCHFPQCSKDVCPVDGCQTTWAGACKGPRPAVYVADGHSGSR